jgi:transcriptional regulator with XRE-family HTH domain
VDAEVRERLQAVFARQDTLEACKRRDMGALISIVCAHMITQDQLGALTGLAQSSLSNSKRNKHQAAHASTFEKFANGLDMPTDLRQALGLIRQPSATAPGSSISSAGIPVDTFDLQLLAEAIGRNGSTVKRREIFSLTAKLGVTAALAQNQVWERLTDALGANPNALSEANLRELEARTAGFHQLEEIVSAPVLFKGLTVHLREVGTLLSSTPSNPKDELRNRLVVVAGESSVLAGWAASDVGDSVTARNFYDTAMKAAKEANDPAIAACALAYRSYIPSTKGANGRARALLSEALEGVTEESSPATVAWIAARHAEESAYIGGKSQAVASWARAEDAFNVADPEEDRV